LNCCVLIKEEIQAGSKQVNANNITSKWGMINPRTFPQALATNFTKRFSYLIETDLLLEY
jgi:hypothetical protein